MSVKHLGLSIGIFAILLSVVRAAAAAEIAVLPDSSGSQPVIIVDGTLEEGDEKIFRKVALPLENAVVFFNSPGGNLLAGLGIGRAIRLQEFATAVADSNLCASACGLAWLGGTQRLAGPNARIGFHAAYIQKNGEASETGAGNAVVGAYLNQLGMSQSAIVYLTSAPPEGMQWLPLAEAKRYGIELELVQPSSSTASTPGKPSSPLPTSTPSAGILKRLNGYDVYGFDLENMPVRNVSLDDCEASCTATSRCSAYTYNIARKVCFLKSGGRTVLSNSLAVTGFRAELENSFVTSPFTIMERTDIPGGDYRKLSLAEFSDCLSACEADRSCEAFTFVKKKSVCWLKGSVSTPIVYRRAVSGIRWVK
jgi:hypothetical protein